MLGPVLIVRNATFEQDKEPGSWAHTHKAGESEENEESPSGFSNSRSLIVLCPCRTTFECKPLGRSRGEQPEQVSLGCVLGGQTGGRCAFWQCDEDSGGLLWHGNVEGSKGSHDYV